MASQISPRWQQIPQNADDHTRRQWNTGERINAQREHEINKLVDQRRERLQKQHDLEMLKNYNPWGKPGAGAPRSTGNYVTNKKVKFTEHDIDLVNPVNSPHKAQEYSNPHRTVDNEIRFTQDGRFAADITSRRTNIHDKQGYNTDLKKQIYQSAIRKEEQKIEEIKRDLAEIRAQKGTIEKEYENLPSQYNPENQEQKEDRWKISESQPVDNQKYNSNYPPTSTFQGSAAQFDDHKSHSFTEENRDTRWHVSNPLDQYPTNSMIERRSAPNQKTDYQNDLEMSSTTYRGGNTKDTFDRVMNDGLSYDTLPEPDLDSRRKKPSFYGENVPDPAYSNENPNKILFNGYGVNVGGVPMVKRNYESRHHNSLQVNAFGEPVVMVDHNKGEGYHPWGRDGAGAPRRDRYGRTIATIEGSMNTVERPESSNNPEKKNLQKQVYLTHLQKGMEEQKMNKDLETSFRRAPQEDVANILYQGKVGKPRRDPTTGMLLKQSLGTTDVTRHKEKNPAVIEILGDPQVKKEAQTLREDLSKAAEERYRNQQLEKLRTRQEAQMHYNNAPGAFGRPGFGAPNKTTNKLNLFQQLENQSTQPYEEKTTWRSNKIFAEDGPESKKDIAVISTLPSNSNNLYDLDVEQVRIPRAHKMNTPWALH